jgi:hypothetical protein
MQKPHNHAKAPIYPGRLLESHTCAILAAVLFDFVQTLSNGQRADLGQGLPIGRASDLLNVGDRSVARAREVQGRVRPNWVGGKAVVQRTIHSSAKCARKAWITSDGLCGRV